MVETKQLTGTTIKGYELEELIGEGGFGAVYRATQPSVKREVAIKIILPDYANDPEFVRRFEAEAQLIANLEHIHIVPLYDYWRDATGAYLVMRYFRGGNLQQVLEKGHWPFEDAPRIVDQIATALEVSHRSGVIHRDLKPANIMLDDEKNAYLGDFGIAKDLDHITDFSTMIEANEAEGLMGSPDYISPEQIKQDFIGPQTDIYSLGLILYKLLTGRKPFPGLALSTLISKHLTEDLPHIREVRPDLPEELNQVIRKATEKNPQERYQSTLELAREFRRAIRHISEESLGELEQRSPDAFDMDEVVEPDLDSIYLDIEPDNPYKGLRAFQEADADDFRGRDALINRLLNRMQQEDVTGRFLAVIGPSGSGKSSVVKAGLIPQLRQGALENSDQWYIVEMVPGTHPLEELEAALLRVAINPPASLLEQLKADERGLVRAVKRILPGAGDENSLVLLIDQFEEVFTMVEDEEARAFFLKSLLNAAQDPKSQLRVIVTLRADFYDRPLQYPEFGELVRQCTEVVLPLNDDELKDAILEPAMHNGMALEAGLVESIIGDVSGQPGSLPLLQYALTELFERRDGLWMTLSAYREIEGVSGALTQRATDIYHELTANQQALVRQMFLRLVTLGEGTEDTRRRVLLSEVLALHTDQDKMQAVVDAFGKYRLLTFDRDPVTRTPTVEVAHEALIRQWGLLREWLDENRDGLRIQRRVATSSAEWENAGRDRSFLASGNRLQQFEEWIQDTELSLTESERDYVQESLVERTRQEKAEAERQAKELELEERSRSRLRALVAVLSIAFVGAVVLSGFALNQSNLADQNAATATNAQGEALVQANLAGTAAFEAEVSAMEAQSLAFASGSQLALGNGNTDLAILLALEANTVGESTIQTRRTLAESAYAPGTRQVFDTHTNRVMAVAYTPDGTQALTTAQDLLLILWDLETGEMLQQMEGHSDWVWDIAVHPDGQRAITASADGTLILWDLTTGEAVYTFEGHADVVREVDISPDGTQALSASEDSTLILWDIETGELVNQFEDGISEIYAVDFSPSGFTALSGMQDGRIVLWNVATGDPLIQFDASTGGHEQQVWTVQYTPDELGFISGSEDNRLLLWRFEAGAPVQVFDGHSAPVISVKFSPDGTRIVSGGEDNAVIVWDVGTGAEVQRFNGHTFLVYDVAYSPDGAHVLSGSWDWTAREWDIHHGALLSTMGEENDVHHMDSVRDVVYTSNGEFALSAGLDGRILLWEMATGNVLREFAGHEGGVYALALSPDDASFISGGADNLVIRWDISSGEILEQFAGHSDEVWTVAYSADGTLIASGGRDNTAILWNVESGEQVNRLFGHGFRITGADFSPDNLNLITSSWDNTLIMWDVLTGEQISQFEGHTDWIYGVKYSPDGTTVASASADGTVILWDVAFTARLRTYEGHGTQVYDVAYSPDGQFLLSGAADNQVILWALDAGEEIQRFSGHTDAVRSVAFAPDATIFMSASADSSIKLWLVRLTLDDLREWVSNNRFTRELTCAERERFGVEPLCPAPTPVVLPGQSF